MPRSNAFLLALLATSAFAMGAAIAADEAQLIRAGHFIDARKQLEHDLKQDSNSAALNCNLGIALLHLHDYRGAFQHLVSATQSEPTLTPAWINLAACYICMNEFDRAVDAYRRVENLMPQSQASLNPLTDFLSSAGRTDENAKDYLQTGWKHWGTGSRIRVYLAPHPRYHDLAWQALQEVFLAAGQPITIESVNNKEDAQFICEWIKPPDNALLLERGLTSCVAKNGKIVGAVVQISTANETGFDYLEDDTVRKTCLHEFMHALGVEGHSSNVEDIMFPMIELPTVEARLSERDKATLRRLYSD